MVAASNSAEHDVVAREQRGRPTSTNGALWYSGPGITVQPSGVIINNGVASGSVRPGAVVTMSLGRPVLPPDVIAFHGFDTVSGSGSAAPGGAGSPPSRAARTSSRVADRPDDELGLGQLDDAVELALGQP